MDQSLMAEENYRVSKEWEEYYKNSRDEILNFIKTNKINPRNLHKGDKVVIWRQLKKTPSKFRFSDDCGRQKTLYENLYCALDEPEMSLVNLYDKGLKIPMEVLSVRDGFVKVSGIEKLFSIEINSKFLEKVKNNENNRNI